MRRLPLALVLCLLGGCGGGCGPVIPEPDSCDQPGDAPIERLELGRPDEESFVPLANGDTLSVVVGGQGSPMMPLRVRAGGAAAPECLAVEVIITDELGAELASDGRAVNTYQEESGGGRTTEPIYVILWGGNPAEGSSVTITASANGATAVRVITVDQP